MAEFTFDAHFAEFLPEYRDVTNVWVGDGERTGEYGKLYARYAGGQIQDLGFVTLYNIAADNGYEGSASEWAAAIINLAALNKGATVAVSYQNSNNGTVHPDASLGWSENPNPVKGQYMWTKTILTWIDNSTSTYYTVSYEGNDNAITSINGKSNGAIVLTGTDLNIDGSTQKTIKQYIDELTFEPTIATKAQIDAMFSGNS